MLGVPKASGENGPLHGSRQLDMGNSGFITARVRAYSPATLATPLLSTFLDLPLCSPSRKPPCQQMRSIFRDMLRALNTQLYVGSHGMLSIYSPVSRHCDSVASLRNRLEQNAQPETLPAALLLGVRDRSSRITHPWSGCVYRDSLRLRR